MRGTTIAATALLALPSVAAASSGGMTGPALLGLVLLAPVGLVLAAITWPFLPERTPRRSFGARARSWLGLALLYDVLLLAIFAKACGLA
ncbi:MAG TPA: hypothetical protein VEB43_04405 [Anaeromyxobacter sp.]|nr:hypothetical protein [Anaeromyxobacter sp.]